MGNCDLIIEVESDPTRRTLHVRPFISSDGNGSRVVKKRKNLVPWRREEKEREREREPGRREIKRRFRGGRNS